MSDRDLDSGLEARDSIISSDMGSEQSVTQAEIDDILSNSAMTTEEKRERLQAYAGELSSRSSEDGDRGSQFEPLEAQILDALSFLADGGHAYGSEAPRSPASSRENALDEPDEFPAGPR